MVGKRLRPTILSIYTNRFKNKEKEPRNEHKGSRSIVLSLTLWSSLCLQSPNSFVRGEDTDRRTTLGKENRLLYFCCPLSVVVCILCTSTRQPCWYLNWAVVFPCSQGLSSQIALSRGHCSLISQGPSYGQLLGKLKKSKKTRWVQKQTPEKETASSAFY